ncbi:MAG: 6-phosphofructokinase [Clostridiales bacterium]|nr:6-phosphofructokinase [Clostridiales bacterium]
MANLKVGILTSGGDCSGLNAALRGAAKAIYQKFGEDNVDIIGIHDGYYGLIHNICNRMKPDDFSGILTQGGTILGTRRTPYKQMQIIEDDKIDKVKCMKDTYKKQRFDCILALGGNGTHKTANLLSEEGLNVISLPKTIDNDIWGTDITFGFHTAVDVATDAIDRIHTTATSHSRIMIVEIMGNKAGWLALYSGIAGGADVILIPEIPYKIDKVIEACQHRADKGKPFSIVVVAEGAFDVEEAKLKKKERQKQRELNNETTVTYRIMKEVQKKTGLETRAVIPGHILRGGTPSAYDRILATQFGSYAAQLISQGNYGNAIAKINGKISHNPLSEVAHKTKFVPIDDDHVITAKSIGISFGI